MEGATPAPCPPWEPPPRRAGEHREEGQREGQGNPAPPSQAGRVGVSCLLSRIAALPRGGRRGGGLQLPECLGMCSRACPPQPNLIKGRGSCTGTWAHVLVYKAVCMCVCVCVPVCASSVCASVGCVYFWLCLGSTGLCMQVNPPVPVSGYVPHTPVCANTCVPWLCVCTRTPTPRVCVCVCTHTRECLRLSFVCLSPFPHHFVLLRVCRAIARGPPRAPPALPAGAGQLAVTLITARTRNPSGQGPAASHSGGTSMGFPVAERCSQPPPRAAPRTQRSAPLPVPRVGPSLATPAPAAAAEQLCGGSSPGREGGTGNSERGAEHGLLPAGMPCACATVGPRCPRVGPGVPRGSLYLL